MEAVSAAVHTQKKRPVEWHVERGERGVYLRIITGSGQLQELAIGADQAIRMAGALRAAAMDYQRELAMKIGEVIGSM